MARAHSGASSVAQVTVSTLHKPGLSFANSSSPPRMVSAKAVVFAPGVRFMATGMSFARVNEEKCALFSAMNRFAALKMSVYLRLSDFFCGSVCFCASVFLYSSCVYHEPFLRVIT